MSSVLIAAGGTGGHSYPGLVLAQTLKARGWRTLVAVRKDDPGRERLEEAGIPYLEVDLKGLPRALSPQLFTFGWRLFGSLRLVGRAIEDLRPEAVIGMGGYLSFPCVLAAATRGVPRAVHESNAVLGLANRACVALGAKLFQGLPAASGPAGTVVGTPIRPALWGREEPASARRRLGLDARKPTLLVFGGSQGARALNRALPEALRILPEAARPQVLHLTGKADLAEVRAAYEASGVFARVLDYLEDMAGAYGAADLVVCRSGASTLAELCAQGKPALLVPYPTAAGGHQEINARVLEKAGAARVILEADLPSRLAPALAELLSSGSAGPLRRAMAEAYPRLGLPPPAEAAKLLADAVEGLGRAT